MHCRAEQQEIMVEIMQETWRGLLIPPPEEDAKCLPAPGDLRRKILVKVKYVPPDAAPSPDSDSTVSVTVTQSSQGSQEGKTPPDTASGAHGKKKTKKKKHSKVIQALSKLGVYTRGVSFKSLSQPEAEMPTHVFSLSEKAVVEVHEKTPAQLFDHNRRFLMRAYPSGLRIGSSNLDPLAYWRKGVQIVALNWQNWDHGMMLNEGMFAGTGGYVLKPEGTVSFLPPTPVPSQYSPSTNKDHEHQGYRSTTPTPSAIPFHTLDLTIQVLAGQSLPLPEDERDPSKFHPYVKVELHIDTPEERAARVFPPSASPPSYAAQLEHQVAREKGSGDFKARTKTRRGRDPEFGDEVAFGRVAGVVPELAFVRFVVRDDDIGRDGLAAWACVRVDRLREGYRFVHLLDRKGVETEGVLLVKVTKRVG